MAKIVKITKIAKTLNAPLFMFSPSRAGGSFLSHEGGEKASDGKMNSRESRCSGSCRGYCVFSLLPIEAWRVLRYKDNLLWSRRKFIVEETDMAVESEEPPESGVGGRVYLLVGYSLFRENVY